MIYALEQLTHIISPIALDFNVKAVWIFGSHARKEPSKDSDFDILTDFKELNIGILFDLASIYQESKNKFDKKFDLVSLNSINDFPKESCTYEFKVKI